MVPRSQNQVCERFTSVLSLGGILPTLIPLYHHDLIAAISCLIYSLRLWLQCNIDVMILHLNGTCIDLNLPEAILLALSVACALTTVTAHFPNCFHQSTDMVQNYCL